jgi:hypothetical protein
MTATRPGAGEADRLVDSRAEAAPDEFGVLHHLHEDVESESHPGP